MESYIQKDTEAIAEFMRAFDQSIQTHYEDDNVTEELIALRAALVVEETMELLAAMGFRINVSESPTGLGEQQEYTLERHEHAETDQLHDPLETIDALGDLIYVIKGAGIALGMDVDKAVLGAIHPSNMSKLGEDGKPIKRADGKVIKSDKYFAPSEDLKTVLNDGLSI